jgi:hypothetical protein
MTSNTLDVFALRDAVIADYRQFATSFTTIHARDIREQVEAIYARGTYWPEPLIQINPRYRAGNDVQTLVDTGQLDPGAADIFRKDGNSLHLYLHQEQAIATASAGESYVVTTGTGSGKSLTFFIPIVSAVLTEKRKAAAKRTRAIIVYPMNALANSQIEELEKYMANVEGPRPITFARYTGQEDQDARRAIASNPPDILLTNFMMLELLMTRQDDIDRTVIGNCAGLRFLVLDELHTYRGRQGADVALLVRRVRERLAPEHLQCVGTSATMASEGSLVDKNRVVASVASRLFATAIPESNVIVETLERVTDPAENAASVKSRLGTAIDGGTLTRLTSAALREHPLAIWVETRLGVSWSDVDQRWVRARPLSLDEASQALATDADRDKGVCSDALRALLLASSLPECDRTGDSNASTSSFFPFKLHQFISGAGHAFSTLEPAGVRAITIEGQKFLPGQPEKRLYPVHFCRECGHEYHPVRLVSESEGHRFLTRDIDDSAPRLENDDGGEEEQAEDEQLGFVTLHPADQDFPFANADEDFPETWLEFDATGNARLKKNFRPARPREMSVAPNGKVGSGARAWFVPGRFRFCLRCRATHTTAARDRTRLASLSAEGRSSATTVLVGSTLRWMHGDESSLPEFTRKLLGFTDNRQDAALQAGHFNDFLFVSLIRAGFLAALEAAGDKGLRSEELGAAQQRALGFDRPSPELRAEWLLEPALRGFNLQEAEATLRQVLSYRVWFDQRRGWRYTNPNLEQLALVSVDYLGLPELAANDATFTNAPDVLRLASREVRASLYREIFDHLRKWMAIRSQVLDSTVLEQMLQRSHSRLRTPWGFDVDETPARARWLFVAPPSRQETTLRDEDLIVRGGSRSSLGRTLRLSKTASGRRLWSDVLPIRKMKSGDFDDVMRALLRAAAEHGLVSEETTPFGGQERGFRLNDACVLFKSVNQGGSQGSTGNDFFRDFYTNLAATLQQPAHPLFGFEARPHTAQVDGERRAIREKRFRYGEKERRELGEKEREIGDLGESNRFLPVLFCSPTMELGVDISALNAVYLRNVPPTPANYAQRSGRAGRSGQAALVLTYSSSQSPHDQYFFLNPKAMVHGEVRAPLLDLANRDLIESHLHAVWLACTELPLDPSIANLLTLNDAERPLKSEVTSVMAQPGVGATARQRIERVLNLLEIELTPELAPWYAGGESFASEVVEAALESFDEAFDRWRDLFSAAEQQRDAARRTMDHYSAPQKDRRAAQARHAQAIDQINLLQQGTSSHSSDFYTYRYLATEGFLPGYNFPRLPLMAYIPATTDGRGKQTYLQRPRFLALSEFGPRSLVYHEGRAYRVVRAMLPLSPDASAPAERRVPTRPVRICSNCGAGHWNDDASMCHACRSPLGDAEIVNNTYRIENVATRPAERITANDEERQRQGFDIRTIFEWATRDHVLDVRNGTASDAEGEVAHLAFGAGATITRLNKGLRRRKKQNVFGFMIDPLSGKWEANEEEYEGGEPDPTAASSQRIVPAVEDRKNALLFRPVTSDPSLTTIATVQHALLRGIEAVFQLEEGEVLAEPMPVADKRTSFLFYEATEGGAGVLSRLVSDPHRLAEVARQALAIVHFDVESSMPENADALADRIDTACVAACYRCVMSYYNQPDHELLDRRDHEARTLLLRLGRSEVTTTDRATSDASPRAANDDDFAAWAAFARSRDLPVADAEPMAIDGLSIPMVWRDHYVAALLDDDMDVKAKLQNRGFSVVVLGRDEAAWPEQASVMSRLLGRSA